MSTTRGEGALTPVLTAYLNARGVEEDQRWAETVMATLVLDGVSPSVIRRELRQALPLVTGSGEGPEELYGPAREWARPRTAELAERDRTGACQGSSGARPPTPHVSRRILPPVTGDGPE